MAATLPERTVDIWASMYLGGQLPRLELWAPTQRNNPDFDFAGRTGKLFVFESKGAHASGSQHVVCIRTKQLDHYLRHPLLAHCTWYVLPAPPYSVTDAQPRSANPIPPAAAYRNSCQKWFWVISAADLKAHLSQRRGCELRISSSHVSGAPKAMTLERFVLNLRCCSLGQRVENGVPVGIDLSIGEDRNNQLHRVPSASSLVFFVPEDDLSAF